MSTVRSVFARLRGLFGKERHECELTAEIESHVQMHADENVRAGMTPEEARRQALLKLGGAEQTKESYRDRRGLPWVETLLQDVRFGLRMLRKNLGFAAVAAITLALGIGATTAIFTVGDKVLLQPEAYPDPDRIVILMNSYAGGTSPIISIPEYMMWRDQPVFQDAALYGFIRTTRVNLIGGDRPEQLRATQASANFFSLFGVRLTAGRTFTFHEDAPGGPHVVLISNSLWHRRFGSDSNIVGSSLNLDGTPYTVIGVTAPSDSPDLDFGDLCIPLQADPAGNNFGNDLFAAARLKPGVSLAQAKSATQAVGEAYRRRYPNDAGPQATLTVEPIHEARVAGVRTLFLVLLGAVGFLLLIACANVANLMLARSSARKREISLRTALGARRGRIVRQILVESVLLSLVGGAFGLFLGYFGVRALLSINPANLPRIGDHGEAISLDWRILAFAAAASLLSGMIGGIVPALKASRTDLSIALKESGERVGTGLHHNKTRSALVAMEMCLSMVLLLGAALLIRSFFDLRMVNPGFRTQNILVMDMSLTGVHFEKTTAVSAVVREGRQRLESVPGVEAAAAGCCLPLEPSYSLPFNIEGRTPDVGSFIGSGLWRSVSSGYFDLFGIPVVAGRSFMERDGGDSEPVVVINETMAKQYWPKGDELGARLTIGGKGGGPQFDDPAREIIGVVADVRDDGLNHTPFPTMYVPLAQVNDGMTVLDASLLPLQWFIRTRIEPHLLVPEVERELRIASRGLPVGHIRSMDEVTKQSTSLDEFGTTFLAVFAAVALLIATVGIYGLMSYAVEQRTREVGIRMALGADAWNVRRMVVAQGMTLVAIGLFLGVAGGLALTRLMKSLLYGVKPWDPLAFVLTAGLLSMVALLACYVPALRASRVDPMVALRHE
jgi:putative ABC transport system permease protein